MQVRGDNVAGGSDTGRVDAIDIAARLGTLTADMRLGFYDLGVAAALLHTQARGEELTSGVLVDLGAARGVFNHEPALYDAGETYNLDDFLAGLARLLAGGHFTPERVDVDGARAVLTTWIEGVRCTDPDCCDPA